MQIIPVIDLMGGLVVRARLGERGSYRPIETPLSATARSTDVVAGLLRLHRFDTLYVADLDAISGHSPQEEMLAQLARQFPDLVLWVDNGVSDIDRAKTWLAANKGSLVIGSESQQCTGLVRHLRENPRVVLSLDFRGDTFLGPRDLLAQPKLWPHRLIVMTLARVGSGAGPDLARLGTVLAVAGKREVYAAGGLRDAADLPPLQALGVKGMLVSTALHDGRLKM